MSPSLRTMGFFMSDINFCNTKEQLNHLGEVVTGKVDGSPTGADIETSTLPYTGQVRKTLPALEGEYEQSITDKEAEADAAIDEYRRTNKGDYAPGILLSNNFEFITYNGESYFATNPPYTTTATTPDNDANLFLGGYTTFENVANKIGSTNLLSNHNFIIQSPDDITHPNATPESYVSGTQIFSGVYAGDNGCTVTLIDGRVNCTAGDYKFKLPNSGGLERVPAFTSSVSDYDGIPKTTGVSHALVADEYVVTVTPPAGDVFSVKLEQGSVATGHRAKSLFDIYGDPSLTGVINVKAFGATGNGVTDDYQAISDAISYLRDESTRSGNIYFPVGEYLVSQPLDCTNFAGGGLYLEGERSSAVALSRLGSTIIGDTGTMVIDMCGTQSSLINDLNIVAGSNNPSTGGIFQARSQTSQYAQFNRFERLSIYFDHDSSANSGRGTYGIYNNASELCSYRDLHIRADTPFLGVAYNPWGITSNYQTVETGIVSSSQLSLTNVTLVSLAPDGFDGQSLRVQSVFGFKSSTTYLLMSKNDHPILIDNFARNFELSGHIEGTNKLMNISNTIGAKLDVTCELTSFTPIQMGDLSTFTAVEGLDLEINSANSDAVTAPYLIEALQTSVLSGVNILSPTPKQIPLTNIFDANVNGVIRNNGTGGVVIDGDGVLSSKTMNSELFSFPSQTDPSAAPINSFYLSTSDNKPYFKDSAGVSRPIY